MPQKTLNDLTLPDAAQLIFSATHIFLLKKELNAVFETLFLEDDALIQISWIVTY